MNSVLRYLRRHVRPIFAALMLVAVGGFLAVFYVPKDTLILKDDGWHPRTLTVPAGTTVTFKNERGKYFWPASDFHPKHLLYPDFDSKAPIAPGESYAFTFADAGTYPFHDHLAAYYFGIIHVEDASGAVPDDCKERGGNFQCWQNRVFTTLAERGVDAAYDDIADLYASDPTFANSCHSIAHNAGLASYQFYRADSDFIYSTKAIVCAAGFYHGFMEGYLGATGDVEAAAALCDAIGERIGIETPDARPQCYHGIGHGAIETAVASTGNFGSLADVVDSAVALCDRAAPEGDTHYRCVSGLYNGIANLYINGGYNLSLATSDPLSLCARQEEQNKDSCYGNLNSLYMWYTKNDLLKASAYLLRIPDAAYVGSSIEYLARMAAHTYLSGGTNAARVIEDCHALPGAVRNFCIGGAVKGLLEHGAPGVEYEKALGFCAEPSLTTSERDWCYQKSLGMLRGWYSEEKSALICAAVDPSLRHYCTE